MTKGVTYPERVAVFFSRRDRKFAACRAVAFQPRRTMLNNQNAMYITRKLCIIKSL